MAKKKNRNKDFDSWLESINSNTYIPQMSQNAPNNANYFADGGPAMGFEYYDDGTGMVRSRMAAHTTDYNIANSPLMDYRTQGFDGTLKMDTLSRRDFDYRNMTPEQQTQFRDYNSNVRQNNRQYRQDVRDTKIADLNAKTDAGEGFLGKMNSNSGANIGGIVAAAGETARVWSDPNSTTLDKVGNLMGIANISKLYTADTEKGDANLNEMTGRLNDFKQNNIQDAWDTLGAGQALKLNKGPNQIKLMSNNLGWKDFKRKNMLGLTVGAIGQGAASGGSVGGAWGAAGGAVTGLFAGLGGMFTNKRRAKKAYREYENKLAYLNNNARMLNAQAQNEWRVSNINAINNGVGQEKINDMANFRAYGGNLFEAGGETPPPYYPESQDPTAIQWLSDWYRQRPEQLKNTFYGSTYEMPNPNISGEYEDLNEIPQERILSPTNRMFGDDLYKNLIDRAATASTIYRMDMPPSTLGEYSPAGRGILTENGPVDKPNAAHTISFNMRDVPAFANPEEEYYDEETLPLRVHEYNHPITHGFESLANSINSKAKRKDGVKYDDYKDNPYEIHSYMMEFRQRAGLDPTEKVTKDVLDKHRTELKKSNLDRFTDDSLIDMLNNVVDNNTNNYNNIAAMGGYFDTFNLSPNMINIQNQSLDNQKYKYNNQIQPLGFFGNSKTSNLFDFGGAMNGMDLPTGMQSYDAGGTHEENPNGGVQVGVDQQGNPNLVEEGEFRWGDYIFSDRIEVDPDILTNYTGESSSNGKKRGKKGKHQPTYADKAKKYAEKNKELANDPIGKNTINDYMDKLSKAEEEQKARDAAQQEYNNALTSPTQGNPMYGSMKYNGMGNANAGLNEGNTAMGGMDNSGLSNVNRSGNEMLHAFGGNLYPYGGDIYNMSPRELYATFGTTDLNVIQSMINQSNAVPETSNRPMVDADGNIITVNQETGEMFANGKPTGQTLDPSTLDVNQPGYNYGQSMSQSAARPNIYGIGLDGKPMFGNNNGFIGNPNWQTPTVASKQVTGYADGPILNNPNVHQTPKLLPNGRHAEPYVFANNYSNGQLGEDMNYLHPKLDGTHWSAGTGTWQDYNNPQPTPKPTPTPSPTPKPTPTPPAKEGPNTNTGGGNSNTGNGSTPPPDTRNSGGNNTGMRSNIDVTGNPGNLNAQYAAGNPWQSTPYQEWTRFGAMAKGLPWVASDAMGHTNWKYKIDNVPPDRMEALGRTGLALRNADHSGMFRAPDLMDVERQNNASQSLLANALRGISNVGGGNRGFVGAQSAAQNYNAQMGIGNNYATTNAYNADQKLKADEFNKQTEQFNVNANNQMEADNQRAKQFAKTYEMQGLQNANAERLHERNYKDAVDRVAAADRANNVTNMWDNALEFMQGEAERNHQFNMANSNPINQYYWDKNKRQYIFKNDPNNPMLRMNNILRRENMGALSANSQKLLNSYIQQYGNNVPQELLDGLVEIERQEQQRLADERKATTNAGYRDLENEYDMLLADYAKRMNTKAEDGTTPKFANYTKDDYGVFEDLRTNRPVDEKGNPISDEDYYSRLRMRANMMRNMMYGANSYYNVGAYGGKICTRKKKQHYYMDV